MADTVQKTVWGPRGRSTRGSSHLRTGLPNQDALGLWVDESGSRAVVVVSDGHGSARHFRSDTGSHLAVEAATNVLRDLKPSVSDEAARELCKTIVEKWRSAVQAHLADHPFVPSEFEKIPAAEMELSQAAIADNPAIAYGATLLAALAGESDVLFLQLGDGDILCVSEDGTTTRPMPADDRLIANQTTSLCQYEAISNFRVARLSANGTTLPALILLSSDGYSNSFHSDDDFLQVGSDYLSLIRQHGADKVEAQLETILSEASKKGSGDDITLAIIERIGAAAAPTRPLPETVPISRKSEPQSTGAAAQPAMAESVPKAVDNAVGQSSRRTGPVGQASRPVATGPDPQSSHRTLPTETTTVTGLRRRLIGYQIAFAIIGVLIITGVALAIARPGLFDSVYHRFAGDAGHEAIRLDNGTMIALKPGALLDASTLRLKPPFEGPILEVETQHGKHGLMVRNRAGKEWSVAAPGEKRPRTVGKDESVPVANGARLMFGKVTLEVVSI